MVAEGNERLRHRRTLAPAFTPHQVERLLPRFVEASTAMLGLLGSGGRANLAAILGRVTLDAAGRALFSVPLVDRAERMAQLLHDYFGRAARGTLWDALAQFLLANEIGSWQIGSARGALGRQWAAEVEAIINERRASLASGEAAPDVLGLLLAARDPESGAPLPDAEVRIQVSSMLAAGFDTTARALFWTVYLLSRDRDEQARVRAEIDRFPPAAVKSLRRPRQMAKPRTGPPRGAQALSDHLGLRPPPAHARLRPRHRDGGRLAGHDQPVGDAPPPALLGYAEQLRARALRRPGAQAFRPRRLHPLRRRPSRLPRRNLCADGSDDHPCAPPRAASRSRSMTTAR